MNLSNVLLRGLRARCKQPSLWFGLALCVLLPINCASVSCSSWFWSPPKPIGDGTEYENIAFHLTEGEGFVIDNTNPEWQQVYRNNGSDYELHLANKRHMISTGRPPLLPLLISGIYTALGRNPHAFAAVRILLASCLALSGALAVYLTAKMLWMTSGAIVSLVGCMATLLFVAANRTLRDYATDFLTEPVALLLMQLFLLQVLALGNLAFDAAERRRLFSRAAWAGATFGALILTRSMFVVWFPGVWILMILSMPVKLMLRLQVSLLFVAVACGVCSPWWVRNMVVLERTMPLGTQGPITLLGGYSDIALQSNGEWQFEPENQLRKELEASQEYQSLENDTQREGMLAVEAGKRVSSWFWLHLGDLPKMAAKRIYVHWNPYTGRSLIWKLSILLGVIALIVQRNRAMAWLIGLPLISTLVVAAFYSTGGRFLVPLYGVLFTLSGLGAASLILAWQWLCIADKKRYEST